MNQLPAAPHLAGTNRRRISEDSLTGLGISQPKRVSRLGGRFSLIDETGATIPLGSFDPQIGVFLDMVICDTNANKSKMFFENAFDPSNEEPPTCFSDNGIAPSANAMKPQSPRCDTCPQNVKGSEISNFSGKEVWACKDHKKLAVLVAGQPGVWLFTIPPASLRKYRDYVQYIIKQAIPGANRNADVADVVTRVYFSKETPNVLEFRAATWISPEIAKYQDQLWASQECDAIVNKHDVPRGAALPASAAAPLMITGPGPVGYPLGSPQTGFQGQGAPMVAPPPPPQPATAPAASFSVPGAGAQPAIAQQQPVASGASPTNGQQPAQPRRRRTKAELEAAKNQSLPAQPIQPVQAQQQPAQQQETHPLDIPAFMRRAPAPPPPAEANRAQQPAAQFGIAQGAADPSTEIARAVQEAFKLG